MLVLLRRYTVTQSCERVLADFLGSIEEVVASSDNEPASAGCYEIDKAVNYIKLVDILVAEASCVGGAVENATHGDARRTVDRDAANTSRKQMCNAECVRELM